MGGLVRNAFYVQEFVCSFASLHFDTFFVQLALPIFYDMMEHDVEQHGNFKLVEDAITEKLDQLVTAGRGDMEYRQLFESVLTEKCQKSRYAHIQERGPLMTKNITDLMTRLLHLRNVPPGDDYRDERASCMYDLLRFYQASDRPKMYMRYIHKLTDIHLQCGYYTEAALTLRLHAEQLLWSDEVLSPHYDDTDTGTVERFPQQTHRERKAQIYSNMIEYFDLGSCWENAIPLCKELAVQVRLSLLFIINSFLLYLILTILLTHPPTGSQTHSQTWGLSGRDVQNRTG